MNKLGNIPVGNKNPVRIMGILNTSPESFFKRSVKTTKQKIRDTVKQMESDGADIIDVGGMSTAPYLKTLVSEKLESKRVTEAIKTIQNHSNLPISVDTCRSYVANSALDLGVEILNDITGLKYDKKILDVISKYNPSLILCAYSKKPLTGNHTDTRNLLKESISAANKSGIPFSRIAVDPAIGFFRLSGSGPFFTKIKSDWHDRDISIIMNLKKIKQKMPLLISVSNKSFIGKIIDKENPKDRLFGSLAAEAVAVINGADIIRTHNIPETKQAVLVASKLANRHKGL